MTTAQARAIVFMQGKGGVLDVLSHPKPAPGLLPQRPELRGRNTMKPASSMPPRVVIVGGEKGHTR